MRDQPKIRRIAYCDRMFEPLLAECEAEGGSFLLRLRDEWNDGAMRFDGPGEALFGAFLDGGLAGVGGLTRDPWEPRFGRLRHLYVLKAVRGRGVGSALVTRILEESKPGFALVRLRSLEAGPFYEKLGFEPSAGANETHRLSL